MFLMHHAQRFWLFALYLVTTGNMNWLALFFKKISNCDTLVNYILQILSSLLTYSCYNGCYIQVNTRNAFHSSDMSTSWLLMNLVDFHISTSSSSYISKQNSFRWFHADCRGFPNGFLSVSAAFNQPNIIVYQITCWKGKFITKTRIRSKSRSSSSSSCKTLIFCPKINITKSII